MQHEIQYNQLILLYLSNWLYSFGLFPSENVVHVSKSICCVIATEWRMTNNWIWWSVNMHLDRLEIDFDMSAEKYTYVGRATS